ncbi:hypothetical protein RM553_07760 [Zunongwangia sp. F363]|uniref:Uncharacterized protein n=1 Tax=Autumnicola tepida TaxID=3075595 RepID=A0ABU3C8R5_9FLAO|nr:hypothetical protein [Zunongwangia sp. F363]MDT0642727.1 hypothetical protein [Zunongwangia sp. F363]
MDLQSRKIEFVQDFLELQSEEAISRLEKLLKKEKENVVEKEINPMTRKELNERIDKSEADFKNNRYKKTSELLSKYKK